MTPLQSYGMLLLVSLHCSHEHGSCNFRPRCTPSVDRALSPTMFSKQRSSPTTWPQLGIPSTPITWFYRCFQGWVLSRYVGTCSHWHRGSHSARPCPAYSSRISSSTSCSASIQSSLSSSPSSHQELRKLAFSYPYHSYLLMATQHLLLLGEARGMATARANVKGHGANFAIKRATIG